MNSPATIPDEVVGLLRGGPLVRIVAFGSSNTERGRHCDGAHNWFDWLDVGLRQNYGNVHHTINAGIGGETTVELLARFERDVAFYKPGIVFLTIGGNDAARGLTQEQFRANLKELVGRIRALENACVPILQTYYSFDLERIVPTHATNFLAFMQGVRDTAAECGTLLVDNLSRWEALRRADIEAYRLLMRDPCHVRPAGNMLWGADICRFFRAPLTEEFFLTIGPGLELQRRIDQLTGCCP